MCRSKRPAPADPLNETTRKAGEQGMNTPSHNQQTRRANRLRQHREYEYMRRSGQRHPGKTCLLVTAQAPDETLRYAIITSRRYSPKAVVRNRARRLLREAMRRLWPELSPAWFLLIPRYRMKEARLQDVLADLDRLTRQAGIRTSAALGDDE